MKDLHKHFFTRKLYVLLLVLCCLGIKQHADKGGDFDAYVFLLLIGFCSSIYSIVMITKIKKLESEES